MWAGDESKVMVGAGGGPGNTLYRVFYTFAPKWFQGTPEAPLAN